MLLHLETRYERTQRNTEQSHFCNLLGGVLGVKETMTRFVLGTALLYGTWAPQDGDGQSSLNLMYQLCLGKGGQG